MSQPRRISWGTGIAAGMLLFLCGMALLVVISTRQDTGLVEEHYYEQGQQYGARLQAIARARALRSPLAVLVDPSSIVIAYPRTESARASSGTIRLYRPSDRALDRTVAVSPDSAWRQSIPVRGMQPGLWRVQVQWRMEGEEYYEEKPVLLE